MAHPVRARRVTPGEENARRGAISLCQRSGRKGSLAQPGARHRPVAYLCGGRTESLRVSATFQYEGICQVQKTTSLKF